jgi:hypothetical protein
MIKHLTLLVVLAALSGCVATSNKIRLPGGASAELPKDLRADVVCVNYEFIDRKGFTNRFSLTMSNVNTRMNPGVIDAKTTHDTQIIKQSLESAAQLLGAIPK